MKCATAIVIIATLASHPLAAGSPLGTVRAVTVDDVYRLDVGMTEAKVIETLGRPWGRHLAGVEVLNQNIQDLKQCLIYPVIGQISASGKPKRKPVRYVIAVVFRHGRVVEWGRYGTATRDGSLCQIDAGLIAP